MSKTNEELLEKHLNDVRLYISPNQENFVAFRAVYSALRCVQEIIIKKETEPVKDERLERIKNRGYGILVYFVEDGKVSELHESSDDTDIFCLQRDAIKAVNELGTQEMVWKLHKKHGVT